MIPSPFPSASPADRPVILIGGQARMVVTLARSFNRRGIPVIHVSGGAEEGSARSRYVCETVQVPAHPDGPELLYRTLEALANRWSGALIVPLNDSMLRDVSAAHARLSRRFRLSCPPAGVVDATIDKRQTAQIARHLGIEVPHAYELPTAARLEELAPTLRFPIFVKAIDKREHARLHGTADFGVGQHPDLASLRAAFAAEPDYGTRFIFQEDCAGHDVLLSLLMHRGQVVAAFQADSVRTQPSFGGVTVLARSTPVESTLCTQIAGLLREIGWEGIAQADLRRDPATGRTVLLEINGRFWGSVSAALHAGVDFPYYVWQLAHDECPAPPTSYPAGRLTRWAMADLKRLLRIWRRPAIRDSRLGETWRFLAAFHPGVQGMMWSWDDPAPAWHEWTGNLRWFTLGFIQHSRRVLFGKTGP